MGKIIDKTKEAYADGPEGAKYLVYEGDDVPEGVSIAKNNVAWGAREGDPLRIKRFPPMWGWSGGGGFCINYDTPQEAIEAYHTHRRILEEIVQKRESDDTKD